MAGTKEGKPIRAFVALDLDAMSVRRLARVSDRLRMASGAPSATWTPRGKMHLTLKFMAGLPVPAAAPLGEKLGALVAAARSPHPGACSLQAFPSFEHANVVVLEFEDPRGEMARLARKIDGIARKLGVAGESRSFRPHVTLARLKRPYDSRRWLKPEIAAGAGDFTPSRLTLYRSDLGADMDGGSLYVPLARFDYQAS
jgi:2'-5' RNA ligase